MTRSSLPHTVTVTGKGQITVPAAVCRAVGLTGGTRFQVFSLGKDRFEAIRRRPSRIMEFAGDLKHLDRPTSNSPTHAPKIGHDHASPRRKRKAVGAERTGATLW